MDQRTQNALEGFHVDGLQLPGTNTIELMHSDRIEGRRGCYDVGHWQRSHRGRHGSPANPALMVLWPRILLLGYPFPAIAGNALAQAADVRESVEIMGRVEGSYHDGRWQRALSPTSETPGRNPHAALRLYFLSTGSPRPVSGIEPLVGRQRHEHLLQLAIDRVEMYGAARFPPAPGTRGRGPGKASGRPKAAAPPSPTNSPAESAPRFPELGEEPKKRPRQRSAGPRLCLPGGGGSHREDRNNLNRPSRPVEAGRNAEASVSLWPGELEQFV